LETLGGKTPQDRHGLKGKHLIMYCMIYAKVEECYCTDMTADLNWDLILRWYYGKCVVL